MKSQQAHVRRSQRIIRMIGELHRLGYQRLRIMPYEAPLAYRIAIGPVTSFARANGAIMIASDFEDAACYTSASGNQYFDWEDAIYDDARQLAAKFLLRFPEIAAAGYGRDWIYAGWLVELIGHLEQRPELLPVARNEHSITPETSRTLPFFDTAAYRYVECDFPLPPPGDIFLQPMKPTASQMLSALLDTESVTSFSAVACRIGGCIGAGITMAANPADADPMEEDARWMAIVTRVHQWLGGGTKMISKTFMDEASYRRQLSFQLSLRTYCCETEDEDITFFTQCALEAVVYASRDLAAAFNAQEHASWDEHGLDRFVALHGFVTDVFLNKADTLHYGRTLTDYVDRPF